MIYIIFEHTSTNQQVCYLTLSQALTLWLTKCKYF